MKVLIIGAGIAGSTLALFLTRAGMECELYEMAESGRRGAALAIAANGLAVLDAAGVLDELAAHSILTQEWAFESQRGSVLACIDDARRGTRLQTRMISRPILQQVLEDRLLGLGVKIHHGKRLVDIVDDPGTPLRAQFADGSFAEGDCLIGADGIGSRVRRRLLPKAPLPEYRGFMAPVGIGPCPDEVEVTPGSRQRVHLVFGRESFFEYVNIVTPEGPRAVWWSTAQTPLMSRDEMASVTLDQMRERLLKLHGGWADPVPRLIRDAESIRPLAIHDFPRLHGWHAGRAMVIGDAAHAIGPHSGQASSMALEDAMLLGTMLPAVQGPAATAAGLQAIFSSFERQRQERLDRIFALGARAAERKQAMSPLKFWLLQQTMRVRVPLGARKSKAWLLDYRLPRPEAQAGRTFGP